MLCSMNLGLSEYLDGAAVSFFILFFMALHL